MYWSSARYISHFEMKSEKSDPPMPKSAQKTSRALKSKPTPLASKTLSKPSSRHTTPTTRTTAMLVKMKSKMRMRFLRKDNDVRYT